MTVDYTLHLIARTNENFVNDFFERLTAQPNFVLPTIQPHLSGLFTDNSNPPLGPTALFKRCLGSLATALPLPGDMMELIHRTSVRCYPDKSPEEIEKVDRLSLERFLRDMEDPIGHMLDEPVPEKTLARTAQYLRRDVSKIADPSLTWARLYALSDPQYHRTQGATEIEAQYVEILHEEILNFFQNPPPFQPAPNEKKKYHYQEFMSLVDQSTPLLKNLFIRLGQLARDIDANKVMTTFSGIKPRKETINQFNKDLGFCTTTIKNFTPSPSELALSEQLAFISNHVLLGHDIPAALRDGEDRIGSLLQHSGPDGQNVRDSSWLANLHRRNDLGADDIKLHAMEPLISSYALYTLGTTMSPEKSNTAATQRLTLMNRLYDSLDILGPNHATGVTKP